MKKKILSLFTFFVALVLLAVSLTSCQGQSGAQENAEGSNKNLGEKKYKYEEATAFLDKGDKENAILALRNCDEKEAAAKRKDLYISLYGEEFYNKVRKAKVGDIITFGSLDQDDNESNGKEPIEWIVLEKEKDGRLVLITKYAIERVSYHKKAEDVTWETCYIRSWLNKGFLDDCFTKEEQWIIPTSYVVNNDNPLYGTDGGNDTYDKVFLLSIEEAQKYFKNDLARKTSATEVAKLHYAYCDPFGNTAWWLRSPSFKSNKAAVVADHGEVYIGAYHKVTDMIFATRPAMRIDLS
ncbi:MAG: hypothetical protein E7580_03160 [Ruminococcaceae bacterium]|nr:hypothetical protein [Oscillospiraceae bacterium]